MLMCVKGVSERVAEAIIAVYPSVSALQQQLQEDAQQLRTIAVGKRKIGKKVIENLQSYF